MKTKTRKIVAIVLAMVTVFCTVCLTSCDGTADETIVIGLSGPLTGEAASYGLGVQNAANMAVEEINAKGGLFGKIKFKLESMDDMAEPSKVATTYSALLNKGMQISLGCVTSGACAEFAKAAKEDSVFFLTPSASNDDIPKGSNAYQMCFADVLHLPNM